MELIHLFDYIVSKTAWAWVLQCGSLDEASVVGVCQRVPARARTVVKNTKTPNQAGCKLPVGGLEASWMSVVWLTAFPWQIKFTRARTLASLDIPIKNYKVYKVYKRQKKDDGFSDGNNAWTKESIFSTAAEDTFSYLKKTGPDLRSDATLSEENNKTLYSCITKLIFRHLLNVVRNMSL